MVNHHFPTNAMKPCVVSSTAMIGSSSQGVYTRYDVPKGWDSLMNSLPFSGVLG